MPPCLRAAVSESGHGCVSYCKPLRLVVGGVVAVGSLCLVLMCFISRGKDFVTTMLDATIITFTLDTLANAYNSFFAFFCPVLE